MSNDSIKEFTPGTRVIINNEQSKLHRQFGTVLESSLGIVAMCAVHIDELNVSLAVTFDELEELTDELAELGTVTISLPGMFLTHFETSSVGQSQPNHGWPGCDDLGAIIMAAPHTNRGRGYSVTINATADHLVCLFELAEGLEGICDFGDGTSSERAAAQTVMNRCRQGLADLDATELLGAGY